MFTQDTMAPVQAALSDAFKLPSCFKIYVPSTVAVDVPDRNLASRMVARVQRDLADMFGGSTATPAQGAWVDASGKLVVEDVVIVYAYCTPEQRDARIQDIVGLCHTIKEEMSQEMVSLEVDGNLYLI